MTQKEIILRYLEKVDTWVHEYTVRAIDTPFGWIGARGDRNVRELIAEGKLESSKDGIYRLVRYPKRIPPQVLPQYKSERISEPSLF